MKNKQCTTKNMPKYSTAQGALFSSVKFSVYFFSVCSWCASNKSQIYLMVRDKEKPSLVFSGDREIPTRGSTVPVNEALPSFPLKRWTRGLGFLSSSVHQYLILFLTYLIKACHYTFGATLWFTFDDIL